MGQPITKIEFDIISARTQEGREMQSLAVGTGLKWPCRWKHRPNCGGASLARSNAKAHGWTIATRCKAGVLYVWRLE